jgi:hypothetical protein
MRNLIRVLAVASLGVAALPPAAHAQDAVTATYGNTTISVGGGAQLLSLPDIRYTFLVNTNNGAVDRTLKNSDLNDYGGVVVGSVESLFGYWGNTPVTGVASGFFVNVQDTDRKNCSSTSNLRCFAENIVDNPNQSDSYGYNSFTTNTKRDVDYWGAAGELRFGKAPEPVPNGGGYLFRFAYWGIGGDVRGIDQANRIRLNGSGNVPINYSETLDTTYSGAFLSIGGEYNVLGYLGIGSSWGLRSLLSLKAGIYNADADYNGRFAAPATAMRDAANTRLGLSDDQAAFIGSATFETRKQFSPRTSLSLVTDYEYYSFAPQMKYVNADAGNCGGACPGTVSKTHIADDDAFEVRTTLRLNIGFGSSQLYEPPLK